jgi:protoglobin
MSESTIPGYDYGAPGITRSPVTPDDLDMLRRTLLWSDDDDRALRMAGEVLADQVDDVIDAWYAYVGANPHLVAFFADPEGQPIGPYLERVRGRFAQWVRDVCERPQDQAWLDYQQEIGLRHTRAKKNQADGVDSVPEVALRYLVALIFPITATMRDFLAAKGHGAAEVDAMHAAWFKAVVLHVVLWTHPYAPDRW